MEGRLRRIPAFGEWNHHYADAVAIDDDWSLTSDRFDTAMWAAVPAYEPIKRSRAVKRCRRIPAFGEWNTVDTYHSDSKGDWPAAITPCFVPAKPCIPHCTAKVIMRSGGTTVGKQEKAEVLQGRRMGRVADVESYVVSKPYYISVVQGINDDDDLYEVPPDKLRRKPMKTSEASWLRCLLMGCFRGLNCTA